MSIIGTIKNLIRWCALTAPSADNKDFPLHQITYVGKNADCLAWYPYGYHANPGAEVLALMLAANADPENRVMFPGSPKERLNELLPTPLAEGELLVFNPLTKSHIHFKADGSIDIESRNDLNINIVGDLDINVDGNAIANVAGTLDVESVGKTTLTGQGTVEIDGATLVDLLADSIKASDGGAVQKLLNEAALAKYNGHEHVGFSASVKAGDLMVVDTDTTSVLEGE